MSDDSESCSNVLYVETGLANKDQIEKAFYEAIDPLGIPCRFRVNLMFGRDDKPLGLSYVWVSSVEIVNALVGKNFDGTERVGKTEVVDDSHILRASHLTDESDSSSSDTAPETTPETTPETPSDTPSDWADEEPDDVWSDDVLKLGKQNERLKPLIETPKYKYNEDQLKYIRAEEGPDAEIPEYGALLCKKAYLPMIEEGRDYNTLVSRGLPDWIDRKEILSIFRGYTERGSEYPKVNIYQGSKSKMAFVSFDPDTDVTPMVSLMTRRIWVFDSTKAGRGTMLMFQFAYDNTDQD